MTRDDIIRMALEAGFVAYGEDAGEYRIPTPAFHSRLERFAALVAAAEREACARLESEMALSPAHFATMAEWHAYREGVEEYTASIRARGQG